MRKYVAPEVFEYFDANTVFATTDKELAIIVFEYAKIKTRNDIDDIKKEIIKRLEADIKKLKKELKKDNDK